jgi:hypothetical protein
VNCQQCGCVLGDQASHLCGSGTIEIAGQEVQGSWILEAGCQLPRCVICELARCAA